MDNIKIVPSTFAKGMFELVIERGAAHLTILCDSFQQAVETLEDDSESINSMFELGCADNYESVAVRAS